MAIHRWNPAECGSCVFRNLNLRPQPPVSIEGAGVVFARSGRTVAAQIMEMRNLSGLAPRAQREMKDYVLSCRD